MEKTNKNHIVMECDVLRIYKNPRVQTGWIVSKGSAAWKVTKGNEGFDASSYFYQEFLQYLKHLGAHLKTVTMKDLPEEVQKIIKAL